VTDHGLAISTIGITTADRPQLLERCLQSLMRQVAAGGKAIRMLVVDASRDRGNEALARQASASVGSANGQQITFFGRREKRALRQTLRSGCDDSLLEFAFRPGAAGNRNIILLLTRGENVLLVDDDMVCDVWRPRSLRDGIVLGGHVEQRDITFHTRRADVCKTLVPATTDLLSAHEAVLGRTIRSLASGRPRLVDTRHACSHIRDAARGLRPSLVRMTFTGIAGDAGATYPDRLLFSTGAWKRVLERDANAFKKAFQFREVCKVPTRYIVMHYVSCMAACMGLANSSLVPPFLPAGRNEDGLFGAVMSNMDRRTTSCYLPYAAIHASHREARYRIVRFPSASETRTADLLISLINFWPPTIRANDPGRRLVRLGEWLQDLGALSRPDFVSATSVATLRTREMELRLIDGALDDPSYPAYWLRDLRAYKKLLLKNIEDPAFLLPLEFRGAASRAAAYDDLRRFVRRAGSLMSAWPVLWRGARMTVSR
jgi:hypothetical protein